MLCAKLIPFNTAAEQMCSLGPVNTVFTHQAACEQFQVQNYRWQVYITVVQLLYVSISHLAHVFNATTPLYLRTLAEL